MVKRNDTYVYIIQRTGLENITKRQINGKKGEGEDQEEKKKSWTV